MAGPSGKRLQPTSVVVGQEGLGIGPVIRCDLEIDVTPAELVQLPVGGQDGLEPGFPELLGESPGRLELTELPDDLPAIEPGVSHMEDGIAAGAQQPPDPVPETHGGGQADFGAGFLAARPTSLSWISSTGVGAPVRGSAPEAVFGKAITSLIESKPARSAAKRSIP